MGAVGTISSSTLAVVLVVVLFGLFVLLLVGSLARARRARTAETVPARAGATPAATGGGGGGGTASKSVVSRRDFFRGGLLVSLLVFGAQFGGASIAFLWPSLKGGFGSVIQVPDDLNTIKNQISSQRQPYYFGAGRFYLINYAGD